MTKQITMMSKRGFLISDEEMEKLRLLLQKGEMKGLIGLKSGDMINVSSIESIGEPDMEAYLGGSLLNKAHTKVFTQGEWKWCSPKKDQIEYKYKIKQNDETRLLQ